MVTDGGSGILEQLEDVPASKLKARLAELRQKHGPDATVLVDGKNVAAALVPAKPKRSRAEVKVRAQQPEPQPAAGRSKEWDGVELAHHMLWESYERAAFIQSAMLEKMTGVSLEMNRRFCDQVQDLQGRFQTAMQKLDVMAFEHKMIEHEAAGRRLSAQFRRMQLEDRKAEESPLDWLEGIARGLGRAFAAFGDGSDDIN